MPGTMVRHPTRMVTKASDKSIDRRQAMVTARLFVDLIDIFRRALPRKRIGAVIEDAVVLWTIRLNDGEGKPALSISATAKKLSLPRSNVRRTLLRMAKEKAVYEIEPHHFRENPNYLGSKGEIRLFFVGRDMVIDAGLELKRLRDAPAPE